MRTLAAAQSEIGHDVAVAGPKRRATGLSDESFWESVQRCGVTSILLPFHHLPFHPRNVPTARRLYGYMRAWRPHVVHSHSTAAGALARPLARQLRMPAIHTPNGVRFADPRRTAVNIGERLLERALAPMTTKVVAVSESEAVVLEPVYHARRVVVVPNGIEVSDEPPDPFPERPRVVSVARLRYQKAPEQTVHVLAELRRRRPGVEAVMVGDGTMASPIQALRDRLDPEIRLSLGDLKGREAIRSSTAVLLTSRWEGAPYVPLEAMERSRPVVASNVVGSRDVVVDDRTGHLFPFGDVEAAVARLVSLIDEPERARRMGAAGRERLIAKYSIQQMVKGVASVYEAALEEASKVRT